MTYQLVNDTRRRVRLTQALLLTSILMSGQLAWAMQQTGSSLEGKVTSDRGEAVPGALVVARQRTSGIVTPTNRAYSAITGSDGSYRIDSIASGDYVVCVQTGDERLLSSCRWPGREVLLTVDGSAAVARPDLRLDSGIVLRFRVDDPEQLLPAASRPNAAGIFLAGVWTKQGVFEPALVRAEDRRGLDLVLTVPSTEELRPYVDGRNVRILAESGALHQVGSLDGLKPGRKDKEIQFHFRVTGLEVRKNP